MKIILDLVSFSWICAIAGGLWLLFSKRPPTNNRKRWGAALLCLAVAASLAEALALPTRLVAQLERPYLDKHPAQTAAGIDAIVVCGGEVIPSTAAILGMDCLEAVDRVMTAVELARQMETHEIVLGGGGLDQPRQRREAEQVKAWIERWNLVTYPVSTLPACRNTHDEALHTAELAHYRGWKTIGLVTSAWHMRRALATFQKTTGLKVIPLATDFRATTELENREGFTLIPGARTVDTMNLWLREVIGYSYYKLRGRI